MSKSTLLAIPVLLLATAAHTLAADIVIEIRGNGTNAQYVQTQPTNPGTQLNVVVVVNDKVTWTNRGDRQHTAHSDVKVPNGTGGLRFLFAETIDQNASQDHTFTLDDYNKARASLGITDGDPVHLGYYCANHPTTMGGKLVLLKSEDDRRKLRQAAERHGEEKSA